MDAIERKVLTQIQRDLPLVRRPFRDLAGEIGLTEDSYLRTLRRLVDKGMLRYIKPILDARALGYQSVLVGMKVAQPYVEDVAAEVSRHPQVTHNYSRKGPLNLWFTFTCRGADERGPSLARLGQMRGVESLMEFPAERTYKIGLKLDV